MRFRFWDWLLCIGISTGTVFMLFSGFLLEDRFSNSIPLVVLFLAAVEAAIVLCCISRRMKMVGVGIGIALLIVFMAVCRSANPFADEQDASLVISLFLSVTDGLLVFLATRTKPGTIVLFVIGTVLMAAASFLLFPIPAWALIVFLVCMALMYWYRNYLKNLMRSSHTKIRILTFAVQSLCMSLAGAAAACIVFFGVIRPLQPPVHDLKLITQMKNMQILKVLGVSETKHILDPGKTSKSQSDDSANGNKKSGGSSKSSGSEQQKKNTTSDQRAGKSNEDTDPNKKQAVASVHYSLNTRYIPVLFILIAAAVAAVFLLRLALKKRWLAQVGRMDRKQAVRAFYRFFLTRFSRCGYKKPGDQTLSEYSRSLSYEMQAFDTEEASFEQLTDTYMKVYYGGLPVSDGEFERFRKFYAGFYKNLRKEIGVFRYLIRIMRI